MTLSWKSDGLWLETKSVSTLKSAFGLCTILLCVRVYPRASACVCVCVWVLPKVYIHKSISIDSISVSFCPKN